MVGLEKFKEAFESFSDNYVIIGGTACEITMTGTTVRPRATHDIDMIVVVEKMNAEFGRCFWNFITEQVISDFRRILYQGELLTFSGFNREHERCLSFIKNAVAESNAGSKIVVTHHVPSFQMQCPEFANSLANGAFTVELQDFIENSGIDFWIYGHSHYNADRVIGKTTCLSNQLGYVSHGEHTGFDSGKCLILE